MGLKEKKFRTQYDEYIITGQRFKKPSLTVPDMSLTINDILKKSLGGNLPALSQNYAYGGNALLHSIPLDITELETSARNTKRRLDARKQEEEEKIHNENLVKAALEKEALKQEAIAEYLASQPQS